MFLYIKLIASPLVAKGKRICQEISIDKAFLKSATFSDHHFQASSASDQKPYYFTLKDIFLYKMIKTAFAISFFMIFFWWFIFYPSMRP